MTFDRDYCLRLAAEGRTLREMAAALGVSVSTINAARDAEGPFASDFARARSQGLELLADDLVTAADDPESDVQRAKLRSENVRWLLSRRLPHQYGDRLNVDMTGQIDLAAALRDASARVGLTLAAQPVAIASPALQLADMLA